MSKSFDDILKEGKNKGAGVTSNAREWKKRVKLLLDALHELNAMYDDDTENHLVIENRVCSVCEKVCYVVVARNIDDVAQKIKFYRFGWTKSKDKDLCEKCK